MTVHRGRRQHSMSARKPRIGEKLVENTFYVNKKTENDEELKTTLCCLLLSVTIVNPERREIFNNNTDGNGDVPQQTKQIVVR